MNIVIQAGGKGTRLRYLGWNKPKCLMPVEGKPLMYHIFNKYPSASFHIIGDYKFDILEKYLKINPPKINFKLYKTSGKGTCCGIADVVKNLDDNPIVVTWGDILYRKKIDFCGPDSVIYKTSCYSSRYRCYETSIVKEKTTVDGIAGIFYFPNKKMLLNVNSEGSFMTWVKNNVKNYIIKDCFGLDELGDFEHYSKILSKGTKSRFFNHLQITDRTVVKECIVEEYSHLIKKEQNWYKFMKTKGFKNIPTVISEDPFILERIKGIHPFEAPIASLNKIMNNVFNSLEEMHNISSVRSNHKELHSVYVKKTTDRLGIIYDLLPFKDKQFITINGLKCKNVFFQKDFSIIEDIFCSLTTDKFNSIHGDPSASNILIRDDLSPVFIDPRGYFYNGLIYGDRYYDYAKFYFSMVSGYDLYNRKKFILYYDKDTAEIFIDNQLLSVESEKIFNKKFSDLELYKIKLINCLIWFGMSVYAIDDVDSIIAAHLLGLYNLEKTIGETNE
jgi:GTP:adenosylcobinamide-phosphate guanylyltransferase